MKGIKNGGRLTDRQVGFLLVVPGLAVFAAIILYPFVDAVLMSFTDRSLLYPDYDWVWLENYVKVFKGPYFLPTLGTTALFVVLATLIPFVPGFIWAILLNQGFKGSELLRGLTLVNWIIPGIAIGFLWSWIFNGQYSVLNGLLTNLGILDKGVSWMGQTQTALLCVVIARSWQMLPWYMAFLLGGLQGGLHGPDRGRPHRRCGQLADLPARGAAPDALHRDAGAGFGHHRQPAALRPALDHDRGRPRPGHHHPVRRGVHHRLQELGHGQGSHRGHHLGTAAGLLQLRVSAAGQ